MTHFLIGALAVAIVVVLAIHRGIKRIEQDEHHLH